MSTKIQITLTTEPEDDTPEHSERVTGSAPGYAKAVRKVMKTAEGRWGWCNAKVEAKTTHKDREFVATNWLGNCSYYSAQDFVENSGYFEQMVKEAVADLCLQLKKADNVQELQTAQS